MNKQLEKTVTPIHDEILLTPALHRHTMKFRARIYQGQPVIVALLTDLGDDNPGASITNDIEFAVRAVIERWPEINLARLVVVEHYDDREERKRLLAQRRSTHVLDVGREHGETFDLVQANCLWSEFAAAFDQRRKLAVTRKHTTKPEIEDLIGGKLP
jgi:hypothetical protein